ncbi:MAG: hypothetical protein IJK40_08965 [Clostridia bacterium]|nr:hypothetical protein [Clostridia bacterium]
MSTDYDDLYRKLYRLFDGVTPLKTDCGVLCKGACCRGDGETGMLLFPFEKTSLPVREENGRRLAVCDGTCDRRARPLSCRIFPFFPTLDENGRIRIVADPRGRGVCPLVRHSGEALFDPRFLGRVRAVGCLLKKDPACRAFLTAATAQINETKALAARFDTRSDKKEEKSCI